MKQLLLILLATGSLTPAAFAKGKKQHADNEHTRTVRGIMQQQYKPASGQKTTAAHWRLIATAYRDNGVLTDTLHFYYSNGRDWVGENYYDTYMPFNNDPQEMQCDSSKEWYRYNNTLTQIRDRAYTYDGNNKATKLGDIYTYPSYASEVIYDMTYGSNGNKTTIIQSDTFGGSAMIPKMKHYMVYDGQNRLVVDSIESLIITQPLVRTVYNYDANGNRITTKTFNFFANTWEQASLDSSVYDNSNRLVWSQYFYYNLGGGGGVYYGYADSMTYTGSNMQATTHTTYEYNTTLNQWVPANKMAFEYNTQNKVDTYFIYEFNGVDWDTLERDVYYYNSNNLLDYSHGYEYMGNNTYASTPYDRQQMYYEEYFPTSVAQVAEKKNEVVVYPNPIRDQMNIRTNIASGTITLHNMLGQTIFSKQFATLNGSSIDMSAYPAGQYILRINSDAGAPVHSQQLTKR